MLIKVTFYFANLNIERYQNVRRRTWCSYTRPIIRFYNKYDWFSAWWHRIINERYSDDVRFPFTKFVLLFSTRSIYFLFANFRINLLSVMFSYQDQRPFVYHLRLLHIKNICIRKSNDDNVYIQRQRLFTRTFVSGNSPTNVTRHLIWQKKSLKIISVWDETIFDGCSLDIVNYVLGYTVAWNTIFCSLFRLNSYRHV